MIVPSPASRTVHWGALVNARDLGGLPAASGTTVPGRIFRTPRLDDLDEAGWAAVQASGVRTLVDLRNDDEVGQTLRPPAIGRRHVPIEDHAHPGFLETWGERLDSPAYYPTNLELWPDRVAAVFAAIAHAPDGGVVVHCSAGRDRTGLMTALLLQLVGTPVDVIVEDYLASVDAMHSHARATPDWHERARDDEAHAAHAAESERHLRAFLAGTDTRRFLEAQGLAAEADAVSARLLD
ncbi:tyrosine-protein phosphatase [Cellulomonas rhizosphaerae]|uniref:Tyrosine-protein phosphatase n=1 Tax=Cellulomonas rhizosphaerae TaxID=2293719 RepID=A0A413RQ63_9CELL|nr:tyrosine-protein phosphatase [Cellulomonas rhizosphaerae]RHA44074.1 tyrosine-protein phosphatase [Cellulomonas rhizosphaerae]